MNSKNKQLEQIKCSRCGMINYVDTNVVHGENGDPFTLHCTFCTAEIESKREKAKKLLKESGFDDGCFVVVAEEFYNARH